MTSFKTISSLAFAAIASVSSTFAANNFGEDLKYILEYEQAVVLSADNGSDQIIISPQHQGRVLTSAAEGLKGSSNGWLDRKADGRYRRKIGIAKERSQDIMASYTPEESRFTIIKFSFEDAEEYPISHESSNSDGVAGDVTNSYNHGNMDGSLLEPAGFFELESAGAMKPLKSGESISHSHHKFHFFGDRKALNKVSQPLLGLSIEEIETSL